MYVSNSFHILIKALSAGALAFSIAKASVLHVRINDSQLYMPGFYMPGAIAGYLNDACTGDYVSGHPASNDEEVPSKAVCGDNTCVTFNTPADFVGIYYGFPQVMEAYSDENCESALQPRIINPNYSPDPGLHNKFPLSTCVNQTETFHDTIGSVKFFSE